MKFTKMHGAGNDYLYVDARGLKEDWPSLSRQMSDRHFGVGGDGLILILESDAADLKMRMFDAPDETQPGVEKLSDDMTQMYGGS